jgi:ribonuclease HI
MPKVVIYTDGGARGNPGPAGAGAIIYEGDTVVGEVSEYLGERTNNWAEYEALILALGEAKRLGYAKRALEVRMDSQLVVEQMRGNYRVKDANLKLQFARVLELLADFPGTSFVHVPRERNKEADRRVNDAIDRGTMDA